MALDARSLLLSGCRGYSSVGHWIWIWNVCVSRVNVWDTVVKTHALRDVEENGGYVKFDCKPMSWLLEDCEVTAPRTASSWRNEMNERNLGLCMLNQ